MEIEKLQQILTNFSAKHQLINRAFDSCRVAIDNLVREGTELITQDADSLVLEFNKQSLVFKSNTVENAFIKTEIRVCQIDPSNIWERGLKPIGKYELDTDLSAEDVDDWLIINKTDLEL